MRPLQVAALRVGHRVQEAFAARNRSHELRNEQIGLLWQCDGRRIAAEHNDDRFVAGSEDAGSRALGRVSVGLHRVDSSGARTGSEQCQEARWSCAYV